MQDWHLRIPIAKADLEHGLVTGWAALSTDQNGKPVIDHQGDFIPIEELEKAAQSAFLATGGKAAAGDMHERKGVADIVESITLTKQKRDALGFGDGPEGWVVTLKVNDPKLRKEIANGEKLELSIRGTARRIPMGE